MARLKLADQDRFYAKRGFEYRVHRQAERTPAHHGKDAGREVRGVPGLLLANLITMYPEERKQMVIELEARRLIDNVKQGKG